MNRQSDPTFDYLIAGARIIDPESGLDKVGDIYVKGKKITKLETKLIGLGFRNCIVVELHTDEGVVGIGETVLKRRSKTVEQNLHELGRYLVGQDPLRIEDHQEKMYRDSFWVGGPLHASAISAIEPEPTSGRSDPAALVSTRISQPSAFRVRIGALTAPGWMPS